mmetsp:Transcript_26976/g.69178  ORF Transcript_26976/g.69178 Transcript_26976/m.69178 type:complete len:170 (+) Transcript_26976:3-512(+)
MPGRPLTSTLRARQFRLWGANVDLASWIGGRFRSLTLQATMPLLRHLPVCLAVAAAVLSTPTGAGNLALRRLVQEEQLQEPNVQQPKGDLMSDINKMGRDLCQTRPDHPKCKIFKEKLQDNLDEAQGRAQPPAKPKGIFGDFVRWGEGEVRYAATALATAAEPLERAVR